MATDYMEAMKERIPDKMSGVVDVDEGDAESFNLGDNDLTDAELDVVVLPPQQDEFTCSVCFLVKSRAQLDHLGELGPVCKECAQ